ncbi:hypothetical protein TraAM80_07102 [Trypanosoma rangeli]|uniref:Uncharacterized protein n=1 Tax=Trypanosoma rangeli TaxID=5698 RepID=A0A422N7L4_TRYRA|nr:uncharacterized protein TraAM80_07102 [Trypanosoma rangeli]RNF01435.1 hypothetical protein TraAM80_07102 [Trypanosoma rangeli]|eukprot:RNF01435.1 hypothetical protein TraAM80_07102 [Trypanosoma rangeli]
MEHPDLGDRRMRPEAAQEEEQQHALVNYACKAYLFQHPCVMETEREEGIVPGAYLDKHLPCHRSRHHHLHRLQGPYGHNLGYTLAFVADADADAVEYSIRYRQQEQHHQGQIHTEASAASHGVEVVNRRRRCYNCYCDDDGSGAAGAVAGTPSREVGAPWAIPADPVRAPAAHYPCCHPPFSFLRSVCPI